MSGRKGRGARPKVEGGGYQPDPPATQGTPPQGGSGVSPKPPAPDAVPVADTVDATVVRPKEPAMLRYRCYTDGHTRLVAPAELPRDGEPFCPMCGYRMSRDLGP